MTIQQIAKHTFTAFGGECIISTVKLPYSAEYETMVLDPDGDDLACLRTTDLAQAKRNHNELVEKWNNELYKNSLLRLLGVPNMGQMVTAIKTC